MNIIFKNHEVEKIFEVNIGIFYFIVYLIVLLNFLLSIKSIEEKKSVLTKNISEEIKGFAILLVVIGHVGLHVLKNGLSYINFADYGVSIFFVLSGYGLTRSYIDKGIEGKKYIKKRLIRVMIPYWIATIIILVFDYILLTVDYKPSTILYTFLGINLSIQARHIDYVRWYITAILLWYILFYIVFKLNITNHIKVIILSLTGIAYFAINYYILKLGYAFLSFPFGAWIGLLNLKFNENYKVIKKSIIANLLLFSLVLVILIPILINLDYFANVPYIIKALVKEICYLIFSFSVIFIFYSKIKSPVFEFLGRYSYEIFLLHGFIMVRYDFILFRGPLFITFWIYLTAIVLLAITLSKMAISPITKIIT